MEVFKDYSAPVPGQALVSDRAATRLAPTGFDPSRKLPKHLIDLKISAEQAANLHRLASYLLTLPAEYPDFDMDSYVIGESSYDQAHVAECGTAACAAGHGPNAGVAPLPDETWETYTDRAFAEEPEPWSWCFSATWADVDNTAHGAAKRILWLLEKGVPDNASQQQWGRDPLCYVSEQAL